MVIPAELSAGERLIGTASAPGAAGPAGSPDPVLGRDMATGSASMARDGRRRPGRAWPSPAVADPGHAPRERTRCRWANRIGHQRGKRPRCCSMANAGELDPLLQPAPPISWRVPRAPPVLQACRQSGSGTRERYGHGQRLDGPGRPATSRACLATPAAADPGYYFIDSKMPPWGGI